MLIGLGVGIDYALFIVTRYRQGMLRGLDREEAVVEALDTSGRAVMFAGAIVCVAMLGMMLLGVSFLFGVAVAAAITVAFTVLSAMTLTPALLSLFGERVLRRGDRRAIAAAASRQRRVARLAALDGLLAKRPALFAALATAVMLAWRVPFFSMRLGAADASSDPASHHHPSGLRAARQGLRPRLQRPAASSSRTSTFAARPRGLHPRHRRRRTRAGGRSVAGPTFTMPRRQPRRRPCRGLSGRLAAGRVHHTLLGAPPRDGDPDGDRGARGVRRARWRPDGCLRRLRRAC